MLCARLAFDAISLNSTNNKSKMFNSHRAIDIKRYLWYFIICIENAVPSPADWHWHIYLFGIVKNLPFIEVHTTRARLVTLSSVGGVLFCVCLSHSLSFSLLFAQHHPLINVQYLGKHIHPVKLVSIYVNSNNS